MTHWFVSSVPQAYGRDLMEAQDWCRKYMRSGNVKDLTQAWDLYYHVFRRISKQLPQVGGANRGTHTTLKLFFLFLLFLYIFLHFLIFLFNLGILHVG